MVQVERYRPRSKKSLVGLTTVPISVVMAITSRLSGHGSEPAPDTGRHGRATSAVPPATAPAPEEAVGSEPVDQPQPTKDPPAGFYRVAEGDSVSSIAVAHGLSTAAVLARNELGWRTPIFPGQLLRLTAAARSQPDSSSSKS